MELQTLFTRTRIPGTELVRTHCIVCGLLVGCSTQTELLKMVEAVHRTHRHSQARVYLQPLGECAADSIAQDPQSRK